LVYSIGGRDDWKNSLRPETLLCQFGTAKTFLKEERRGGNRFSPFAFTEGGVAMLSNVLKSERVTEWLYNTWKLNIIIFKYRFIEQH
jgi:hypothetical protein